MLSYEAEDLECAALRDLHKAAPTAIADALGLQSLDIGAAFVSIAAGLPASAIVINRAIGMGLSVPETEASVRTMVDAYRHAGVTRYFVQRHPSSAPAESVDWLLDLGLERARGWQKFSRGSGSIDLPATDLSVRRVGREQGAAFARIACDAFDLGKAAEPWLAEIPGRSGWHIFMSFDGDEPAGTGALFVRGDLAWCDFGATTPKSRGRGSQSALLAHRVRHAINLGCRNILTCTGEDVPGDPQHSYKNILKTGFHENDVRENYAPPKPRA